MVIKNKVGRPAKTFKPKPKLNIIRSRGRPRKNSEQTNKFPQLEEIKKRPISFVANKVKKNSKIDNIALGLLVFSILLFIFSVLFKGNRLNNTDTITQQNNNTIVEQEITKNIETGSQITNQITQDTGIQVQQELQSDTKNLSPQEQLISDFYQNINDKNFENLINLTDVPLRQSNTYRTYYNSIRLANFIDSISNNTIYITDIKEIPNTGGKAKKYQYTLEYKLESNNSIFTEQRNASIVYKNNKNLIGSIMCINKGCSLNPFFNPKKY